MTQNLQKKLFFSTCVHILRSAEYNVYLTYIYRVCIVYLSCLFRDMMHQIGFKGTAFFGNRQAFQQKKYC